MKMSELRHTPLFSIYCRDQPFAHAAVRADVGRIALDQKTAGRADVQPAETAVAALIEGLQGLFVKTDM